MLRNAFPAAVFALAIVSATAPAFALSDADLLIQYNADIRKARDDAGKRVEIHIAFLEEGIKRAIASQQPEKFKGFAEKWIAASKDFEAMKAGKPQGAPELVSARDRLMALKTKILDGEKNLRADMLAGEKMPEDVYKGSDKGKLLEAIKAKWAKDYPEDKVLAVRFDHPGWERSKTTDWVDGGGYFKSHDLSTLVVRVIVRKDDRIASVHSIYLQKDNLSPEIPPRIGAKNAGFDPTDMLLSNVK